MPSRALFKDKQLRLCVVTTLAVGPVVSTTEALLLPPKPLAFSSTWDCRSGSGNDWLCRTNTGRSYNQSLESVTQDYTSEAEHNYGYQPAGVGQSDYGLAEPRRVSASQYLGNPAIADSAILIELLNAPPENYVLQWLAANEREPLERLKAQNPVLQDATIAQYQRAGRQWFILLDGPFPSRIAAMAALKREPRAVIAGKFYPWTRSIASIQQLNFIRPEQMAGGDRRYPEEHIVPQHNQVHPPAYQQGPARPSSQERPLLEGHYEANVGYENNAREFGLYPDERQLVMTGEPDTARNYAEASPHHSRYPERFDRSVSSASRVTPASVPDRYGHPEDYIDTQPDWQQRPSQLAQPFRNAYGSGNPYSQQQRYRDVQRPQDDSASATQYKSRELYNPYALSERYLKDLRYATASIGQQIIIPPTAYQANTRHVESYPAYLQPDYRAGYGQPPDYNVQQSEYYDYGYNPEFYRQQPEPEPNPRSDYGVSAVRPEVLNSGYSQPYADTALNAPPGSYTIQWLAANNKASLERVQLRYPSLQNTRIIHYRRRNANWYVLVGGSFGSREAAQSALSLPPYSRLTARLYPWVRSVEALQKMVAGTVKKKPASYGIQHSPLDNIISGGDNSYTIQWYAANKPEAVKRMKRRFPELANAVTIHFRRNQKDWYVLLQGQYHSSQDAISAIKSPAMRDAARMLHPWTRPLNTLRNLNLQKQS